MSRRVLIQVIALLLITVFLILLIAAPHYRRMEPLQFYLLLALVFLALILLLLLFLRARQLSVENRKYIAERDESEAKIIKANRLYLLISQINQMIVKTTDEATLFKEACRIAIETGKFKMAWVGIIDESTRILRPVMHDGMDLEYLSAIKIIADNRVPEGRGPTGTALLEGKYVFCNDIETDPRMVPWRTEALKRNYLSSIALPIMKSGKLIGAFTLYADTKNFFDAEEIALLEETARDISFALDVFEKEMLRKRAEAVILERERRYQTLAESSPVGIFHTDASGYTTYVNPMWSLISGLPFQEALGDGWFSVVHPEDKPALVKGWQEATKKQTTSSTEYRFVRPDGTIAWVIGQAVPERNAEHEIIGYVGTITDITEHKKAEQEIARIYKEKETALNRIKDRVISLDNEWRYTFLNDAAMVIHPEGKKEIIGKTIWEVHPELIGTNFQKNYQDAMRAKKVVEFEDYYAPMDSWFFAKVYPSDDGLTVFYKDITEQKKAEEDIRSTNEKLRQLTTHLQTIREEERKRIGREIHDELGQQLTAIKMDVAWIDKKIPEETTLLKAKLKNIMTLLDGSNQSIRRILSELRPGVLDENGLLEAMQWLDSQFTANTGIPVIFSTVEKKIRSSEPIANCIFRVYQEALTNITRYANAHKVFSSLNITGDNIVVTIEDDGQGFDMASVKNKKSFGILGMKERVLSLGGAFELISSPGKGTKIIISLPYITSDNS
ncbi:PAS domain S-box protein [Panacibacter ginsenosidivorans]|nr:PAS domain S-box protein [Panacibacter ginsenosidivorans]